MAARELSPLLSYKQVNRHPDKKGGSEAIPSQGVRLARALAASGATTLADPAFSLYQDHADPFDYARREFQFPKKEVVWPERFKFSTAKGAAEGQEACVYLAGNSLGLMPRNVGELILQELDVWRTSGVMGHTQHAYDRPWIEIDKHVTPTLARIVGAKVSEVACMGSLTANLHALFSSFYRPTPARNKIMYEGKAFPSDAYAFASQISLHDYPPSSLLPVNPLPGEFTIRTEEILRIIEEEGESIAVICFGAVQYYSGEWFDMEAITKAGHAKGCIVAFDCAHAVGNVPLQLHDWGVDFACWCSYKYLNAGPGAIAGIFVHERWEDRKRLAGWWGHTLETRFAMPSSFSPTPGAAGWQFSNPSVLDVVSLLASLKNFEAAGRLQPSSLAGGQVRKVDIPILASLREKSVDLTSYLEILLKTSRHYLPPTSILSAPSGKVFFTIITPSDPRRRGAQLSLLFSPEESMVPIFEGLRERGVLGDERKPGVIRLSPVPLYNSWEDCRLAAAALEDVLRTYPLWLAEEEQRRERAEERRRKLAAGGEADTSDEEGVRRPSSSGEGRREVRDPQMRDLMTRLLDPNAVPGSVELNGELQRRIGLLAAGEGEPGSGKLETRIVFD